MLLKSGQLYVAATLGGSTSCGTNGCGVILMLTPPASGAGAWTRARIHSFQGESGGANPFSIQSLDSSGGLYGVTLYGGNTACPGGCGTVFRLTPPATSGNPWTKSIVYRFRGGNDGYRPYAGLVRAPNGDLFGTTRIGGGQAGSNCPYDGCGTVYRLRPSSTGSTWTETVLHRFDGGAGGSEPFAAGLVRDPSGVLYGLAAFGGEQESCENLFGYRGCGVAFSLTPPASGGTVWTKKILYNFPETASGFPGGAHPYKRRLPCSRRCGRALWDGLLRRRVRRRRRLPAHPALRIVRAMDPPCPLQLQRRH